VFHHAGGQPVGCWRNKACVKVHIAAGLFWVDPEDDDE
jgi:hypothetical protein